MKPICLIRQPAGLGDIFFCQKIGEYYQSIGYRVIWPIAKVFSYIPQYMTNFEYPCEEDDFPFKNVYLDMSIKEILKYKDFIFIPLHGHNLRSESVMYSKYLLNSILFNDWFKFFNFTRHPAKENYLYYDILKLEDKEKYTLFNNKFASPPDIREKNINIDKINNKIVKLEIYDNITVFDWCKVFENAKNILTVDTAINYIIDKLDLQWDVNLQLYSRYEPANYNQIKGIFKKRWKYNS